MVAPVSVVKRGGRGWMIFSIILLLILAVSIVMNVASFFSAFITTPTSRHYAAGTAGPRLDEVVREDNDSSHKLAVIEVRGIITGDMMDQGGFSMVDVIRAQLKHAKEDSRVKAVLLKIDSPGGEVLASDEINSAIADFQRTSSKPVVASMGDVAASGGYYVAAPCRWIVANEMTITGSIGVIMSSWNYRGLMNKVGIRPQVYKSGKHKDMLSGSRDPDQIPEEEREMLQSLINETYGKFKSVVSSGRTKAHEMNKTEGRELTDNWVDFADGRVFSGKQAHELGFVDQVGNFQTAIQQAKKLAGISSANLVEYQQRYDFSDFFKMFGRAEKPGAVKLDLGFELPKLETGHVYFLAPNLLP